MKTCLSNLAHAATASLWRSRAKKGGGGRGREGRDIYVVDKQYRRLINLIVVGHRSNPESMRGGGEKDETYVWWTNSTVA